MEVGGGALSLESTTLLVGLAATVGLHGAILMPVDTLVTLVVVGWLAATSLEDLLTGGLAEDDVVMAAVDASAAAPTECVTATLLDGTSPGISSLVLIISTAGLSRESSFVSKIIHINIISNACIKFMY